MGVLSFQEQDISEKAKRKEELTASFEKALLAGLEQDQYNILWVEHKDKDRLELNFVIPKVELHTGKAMNPYFDRTDRELIDAWKQITNYDYQLHDPNDPKNKQTLTKTKDLLKDKRAFKEQLTFAIEQLVLAKEIHNRDDVVEYIKSQGLEIARTTPNAISIKDPDGGKNIRLKGELYEQTFTADRTTKQTNDRESQAYRNELRQRITELRKELESRNTAEYRSIPDRATPISQNQSRPLSKPV